MYESQLVFFIIFTIVCLLFLIYLTFFVDNSQNQYLQPLINKEKHHRHEMFKKCFEKCSPKICRDYIERLHKYHKCHNCRMNNMCYSQTDDKCYNCPAWARSEQSCTDLYGCDNPTGFIHGSVPPINPEKTHCQPCWENI